MKLRTVIMTYSIGKWVIEHGISHYLRFKRGVYQEPATPAKPRKSSYREIGN